MELSKGRGYPVDFEHFAIAERFNESPAAVLEWPIELVEDARALMRAETRYEKRHPKG